MIRPLISSNQNPSFGMAFKFKEGGIQKMARDFMDTPEAAKKLITKFKDDKLVDIIVDSENVFVNRIFYPLEIPFRVRGTFNRESSLSYPIEYVNRGTTSTYRYKMPNDSTVDIERYGRTNSAYAVAEDIANDIKKQYAAGAYSHNIASNVNRLNAEEELANELYRLTQGETL